MGLHAGRNRQESSPQPLHNIPEKAPPTRRIPETVPRLRRILETAAPRCLLRRHWRRLLATVFLELFLGLNSFARSSSSRIDPPIDVVCSCALGVPTRVPQRCSYTCAQSGCGEPVPSGWLPGLAAGADWCSPTGSVPPWRGVTRRLASRS